MVLIESLSTSSDTAPTNCEVIIEGGGVVRAVGKKFLQQLNFQFYFQNFLVPQKYVHCMKSGENDAENFFGMILCNPSRRRKFSTAAACQYFFKNLIHKIIATKIITIIINHVSITSDL